MSRRETFHCDVCGVERKESNHWFLVFLHEASGHGSPAVSIQPWDFRDACMQGTQHACGHPHACVLAERRFDERQTQRLSEGAQ